jgi:hypothetical protein
MDGTWDQKYPVCLRTVTLGTESDLFGPCSLLEKPFGRSQLIIDALGIG